MSTPPTPYTLPPELLATAEAMLANAGGAEFQLAARAYTAYCGTTGGRSAVTGAQLPPSRPARRWCAPRGWPACARCPSP